MGLRKDKKDEPNTQPTGLDSISGSLQDDYDDEFEQMLYARHVEIESAEDLTKQRGTPIPALFNQFYKFVQNPSSVSVETYKRMVDTDDTIGSGVDFLVTCLAARMGRYTHPSKEVTEFVNKALDGIQGGWTGICKEIFSATWIGYSASEKVWDNTSEGFVPKKIVTLPPSTVLFETERTGELTRDGILQYQRNWNPFLGGNGLGFFGGSFSTGVGFPISGRPDQFARLGDLPFPLRTANTYNYLCIRIPVQKCIHVAFDAQGKFGNPYGRSLLRRAYKYYVMKDAFLQMMSVALDRKGTALTIVYCDPNTTLEDTTKNPTGENPRDQRSKGIRADLAARGAFKNVHNDTVIYLPGKKGEIYDVDFMPQAPNTADFIQALDFCNKSILRALLIPTLIFGNGDGTGSYSLGQEHARTFDKVLDGFLFPFQDAFLQQLVREIIAYNFPESAWKKDGLGGFSKRDLTRDEVQKEMEVYEKGVNMGIIDTQDLNDLNKMREASGFEPRETVIEKESLIPGEDEDAEDQDDNQDRGKDDKSGDKGSDQS